MPQQCQQLRRRRQLLGCTAGRPSYRRTPCTPLAPKQVLLRLTRWGAWVQALLVVQARQIFSRKVVVPLGGGQADALGWLGAGAEHGHFGRAFRLGATVKVTVDKVDRFKRQVDFRVFDEAPRGGRGPERRKGGR